MDAYHQSKHELDGLPNTVTEKIPVTNTPNIFSYKSYVFAKNPALVRRFIKATKADVGGVGGHIVAANEVKSIIAKYVLYDIEGVTRSSRFVIGRIGSRNEKGKRDQLDYISAAERLYNIKARKGVTY